MHTIRGKHLRIPNTFLSLIVSDVVEGVTDRKENIIACKFSHVTLALPPATTTHSCSSIYHPQQLTTSYT